MIRPFLSDLRSAVRLLGRRPRFALLAAGAYAVGIGAVTAVFGLFDDVVLDPLPWPTADEVVGLWERYPPMDADRLPAAPAKIRAWAGLTDVFTSVRAWRLDGFDLSGPGPPERLPVGRVEPGMASLLGVEPALGRAFAPGEGTPGRDGVALLTHGFWTDRFGADPGVLGRTLTLEGRPREIVGVLPAGRQFPEEAEVLVPLVFDEPASRSAHAYRVLARLAPGVPVGTARARMDDLADRLEAEHPATDRGWEVTVVPLRDQLLGDLNPLVMVFLGAGGLVFLVACANGGSLLLVRATGRRRELAVRAALGASRGRLVRHLAAESLVLSLAGGVGGLALARLASEALLAVAPAGLPATVGSGFDATVYLFTLAAATGAGLVFGLLPALQGTGRGPVSALRAGSSTASRARARGRSLVVAAEVAMAALLLVGSGLFVRTAVSLAAVDPGFEPRGLLAVDLHPPAQRYPEPAGRLALYRAIVEGSAALPGVQGAALVSHLPLGGRSDAFRYRVEGRPAPTFADQEIATMRAVTPDYFRVMRIDVRRGRGLEPSDGLGDERVAVVGATMAREQWPDGGAVGSRIDFSGGEGPWIRVVGVVEDVHHASLTREPGPDVYVPMAQDPWSSASLVLRSDGDPLALVPAVRGAVVEADPLLPLVRVRTGPELVEDASARWRFQALLVAVFAAVALVLAVTGVYGLLAFVVQERAGEMAIRRALGARAPDLRALVGKSALGLATAGTAVGLGVALVLSRSVRGMLYGVGPLDPASYVAAAFLLAVVSLAAAWIPVRRAGRVDPADALRTS